MATKTFEELKQLAIQIRDEKTNKQNTATRVGTAMLEHINKLEQDYYDKTQTDEELKERDDKLTELKDSVNLKTKYTLLDIDYPILLDSCEQITRVSIFSAIINSAVGVFGVSGSYNFINESGNIIFVLQRYYSDGTYENKTIDNKSLKESISNTFTFLADLDKDFPAINDDKKLVYSTFIISTLGQCTVSIENIQGSYNVINSIELSSNESVNDYTDTIIGKYYNGVMYLDTILQGNGESKVFKNFTTSSFILVNKDYKYIRWENLYSLDANKIWCGLALYNSEENVIAVFGKKGFIELKDYPDAEYLRYCYNSENRETKYVIATNTINESVINVADGGKYGDSESKNLYSTFMESDWNSLLTTSNSYSNEDGIISEVTLNVSAAGKVRLCVGLLDQRNIPVIANYFDVDVNGGLQTINIEEKLISISKGQQLFSYIGYYKNAIFKWVAAESNDGINNEMLYGKTALKRLANTYGGRVNLSYKVKEIISPFASKSEVNEVKETLSSQQEIINTMGIVYDSEGNAYKLKVIDGNIVPISLNYKKRIFVRKFAD